MSAIVLDVPQGSAKWHEYRRRRYGASEVPKRLKFNTNGATS